MRGMRQLMNEKSLLCTIICFLVVGVCRAEMLLSFVNKGEVRVPSVTELANAEELAVSEQYKGLVDTGVQAQSGYIRDKIESSLASLSQGIPPTGGDSVTQVDIKRHVGELFLRVWKARSTRAAPWAVFNNNATFRELGWGEQSRVLNAVDSLAYKKVVEGVMEGLGAARSRDGDGAEVWVVDAAQVSTSGGAPYTNEVVSALAGLIGANVRFTASQKRVEQEAVLAPPPADNGGADRVETIGDGGRTVQNIAGDTSGSTIASADGTVIQQQSTVHDDSWSTKSGASGQGTPGTSAAAVPDNPEDTRSSDLEKVEILLASLSDEQNVDEVRKKLTAQNSETLEALLVSLDENSDIGGQPDVVGSTNANSTQLTAYDAFLANLQAVRGVIICAPMLGSVWCEPM